MSSFRFDCVGFKKHAMEMPDEEFYRAYDEIVQETGFFDYTLTNIGLFLPWIEGPLLEVGCASGATLASLHALNRGRPLCGVDVSNYALGEARQALPGAIDLYWADAEKRLPFADGSWDTVLCGHVLEHLRHPEIAIAEIQRVCRRRAIILIPLQGEAQRWKPTNLHIQFWPTVKDFERTWGWPIRSVFIERDATLAVMLFCMEDRP